MTITCPDWCITPPEHHAANLWDMGGHCIHYSVETQVIDDAGYSQALTEPTFHPPVELYLTASTQPDGRETASPIFCLNRAELSIQQARALAAAITRQAGA